MTMLSHQSFEPGAAYLAYQTGEGEVRKDFLSLGSNQARTISGEMSISRLLHTSALFLEVVLVAACGIEFLTDADPQDPKESLASRIKTQCDLDLNHVFQEALAEYPVLKNPPAQFALPSMDVFLRSVRSIIAACPIEALVELGSHQDSQELGFRCHRAFEALHAFIFRQDPQIQKRAKLVGQIYAKGEITLAEVSLLLDLHPTDAIWWLEQSGYSRAKKAIQLSENEREQIFSRMRVERLERQGIPVFSEDYLLRDVISSERIEGVDARPWVTRSN